MTETLWRAGEVKLGEGAITIDVAGSGKLARIYLRYSYQGVTQDISTLEDFARILAESNTDRPRLAESDPVGFVYVLCVLSGRRHHAPVREFMWRELESRYGLKKTDNQPRVTGGTFQIVVYHFEGEHRVISRLKVNLETLGIEEESLIDAGSPAMAGTSGA